jgi:hypothetical protein
MRPYGLPVHGLDGIAVWEDLADPEKAQRMADEMQRRAAGDVPVNLAATSLPALRWLDDGDEESAAWIRRYVEGWLARARANGGVVPDNVGPDGTVGALQDGRWWGGHYGWAWPHGFHSVAMSALIGAINHSLVTGRDDALDLVRPALDTVLAHAEIGSVEESTYSLRGGWRARLGAAAATPGVLVPYRHGIDGWFDFGPLQLDVPVWLWWWSRSGQDRALLDRARAGLPQGTDLVAPFRDKEEAGHEAGWIAYLSGELPEYPERALEMALGQVSRRVAMMLGDDADPDAAHLHFWQRVNPVVTEVLTQLVGGAPQMLYNGGLPFTALRYEDVERGRPGLPRDVAALVHTVHDAGLGVRLVNTSVVHTRTVRIRGGRFGADRIVRVSATAETPGTFPGPSGSYRAPENPPRTVTWDCDDDVVLELPPAHGADLDLTIARGAGTPRLHPSGGAA